MNFFNKFKYLYGASRKWLSKNSRKGIVYSSFLVSDSTISQSFLYHVVINTKTKVYFILIKNLFLAKSLYPERNNKKI